MTDDDILTRLRERFGQEAIAFSEFRDNRRVVVSASLVYAVLEFLKKTCAFDMLAEMTAVDYLRYPDAKDRFGVVYCLLCTQTGTRLVVKTFVNDPDPVLPSACPLWKG